MSNISVVEDGDVRRGPWTLEEDTLLTHYIARHGEGHWNMLAKCAGLKRNGKSCRLRWLNYLKPDIKRGNLTPQEQLLILELHSKWGNRWSKIAQHLPGRTDNEIKNYWRTRVQKQARQLNIESNSKRFLEAVKCFWMPRLLQKVEQTSSSLKEMNCQTSSFSSQLSSDGTDPSLVSAFSSLPNKLITDDRTSNHLSFENSGYSSVTSQSLYPTDFITISERTDEIPQLHLTSNPADLSGHNNNCDYISNQIVNANGSYNMDSSSYDDMEGFSQLASMLSPPECQVAQGNWMSYDMTDTLWNMDDTWQFREMDN